MGGESKTEADLAEKLAELEIILDGLAPTLHELRTFNVHLQYIRQSIDNHGKSIEDLYQKYNTLLETYGTASSKAESNEWGVRLILAGLIGLFFSGAIAALRYL